MENDIHTLLQQWQDLIMGCVAEQDFRNDADTRHLITQNVSENLSSRGSIYDFQVTCDDRNNTVHTIDQNSLIVDITLAFECSDYFDVRFSIEPEIVVTEDLIAIIEEEYASWIASNPYMWCGALNDPIEPDFLAITRDIANGSSQ